MHALRWLPFGFSLVLFLSACPLTGDEGGGGGGGGGTGDPPGETGEEATSATQNPLSGICQAGSGNLFLASDAGKLLTSADGTTYTVIDGTAVEMNAVGCDQSTSSSTRVWFVGNGGSILHYNGTALTSEASGSTQDLLGVSALRSDNVVAVGKAGTILHDFGSGWGAETAASTESIHDVTVLSNALAFAVGDGGAVLQYVFPSWNQVTLPGDAPADADYKGIWGLSTGELFVVGSGGAVLHRTAAGVWETQTSGTTKTLLGVSGISANRVIAVGENNTIISNNGSGWVVQELSLDHTFRLTGVVSLSEVSTFIVGAKGSGEDAVGIVLGFGEEGWLPVL